MKSFMSVTVATLLSVNAVPCFAGNPTPTAPSTEGKFAYQIARAECLKRDTNLKGPSLRACIKNKRKLASKNG